MWDVHGLLPLVVLRARGCSIYDDRPRTCRAYDCRVQAAAGTTPDGEHDADIAARVSRWRFRLDGPDDEARWTAVHIAARRLETTSLPADTAPRRAADVAAAAVHAHELFLDGAVPGDQELAGALLFDRSEQT